MKLEDKITALTVLAKEVKAQLDTARGQWAEDARTKQRDVGGIGDEALGTVSREQGSTSWRLVDRQAFTEWAQAHAPHLVEYSAHVPEHHVTAIKKKPVTEDGEIIPGFDSVESGPKTVVRLEDDAADVVRRAVQSGALSYGSLLEIES